jgi:hypothetical protein
MSTMIAGASIFGISLLLTFIIPKERLPDFLLLFSFALLGYQVVRRKYT